MSDRTWCTAATPKFKTLKIFDEPGPNGKPPFHLYTMRQAIDERFILDMLKNRENLGSTGLGNGVAFPLGRSFAIKNLTVLFARSASGVDFDSLDGGPTHLFFLLVAPEDAVGQHLKALARVSRLLKDAAFRQALVTTAEPQQLFACIRREDEKY